MAEHNETGKEGELLAKSYLEEKSFRVLEQNFRYGKAEIDMIAMVDNFIVAIEVKTRKSAPRIEYFHAVTKAKMNSMVRALEFYMRIKGITLETRFDFVRVDLGGSEPFIEHTPSFFIP